MQQFKYQRVLLKISGEALGGAGSELYNNKSIDNICQQIQTLITANIQVGIVVGGGNIWRGAKLGESIGLKRINADYMGMLATIMNALVIESKLKALGVKVLVQSSLEINQLAERFYYKKAISSFEKGYVCIFAGGTGSPYFTTDTAAVLRAIEIDANVLLMAKNGVDGVYNKDPVTNKDAIRYEHLTYQDITNKQLKVMDLTASTMCMEANLKTLVFDINIKNNIIKAVQNRAIATIITNDNNKK